MTPSRKFVLALDSLLAILFLFVLAPQFTALPWHEWLGLVLVVPVLVHLVLSWKWIAGVLRKMLDGAPVRTYVNVALNTALFVLVINEIVSGIVISQVALPWMGLHTAMDPKWRAMHNNALGWMRLILALHVAMNWSWIVGAIRKWRGRAAAWFDDTLDPEATIAAGIVRTLVLAAVSVIVGVAIYWWVGPPANLRFPGRAEILKFGGSHFRGVVQLSAQIVLLTIVAYVGRRWLRVRL